MRDTEAVASIVAGDADGLAAVYDRYADPLFKYCGTLLSDPADAAGAVQDTFVIAAARLGGLREPERLRAWLYTVARNECMRIMRAGQAAAALGEAADVTASAGGDAIDGTADGADEAAGNAAENANAHAGLSTLFEDTTAGLNPGEREVIELQLRQGLDAADVAAVLGVSRGHAHTMLSRASEQLEICLGVLLVARAGRAECAELGSLLTDWDGRLTVLLRKRVQRHIERCPTCSARRAFELRPAMLLDLTPGAALAAGAGESLRLAPGVPPGLRAHTVALATGQGPSAIAHSSAVLSQAGTFGKNGFPKPAGANGNGGGASHVGGAKAGLRSSPQGQAAVAAAVVIAVVIAGTAVALSGSTAHLTAADDPEPAVTVTGARTPAPPSPGRATSAPGSATPTRAQSATPAPPAAAATAPRLTATTAASPAPGYTTPAAPPVATATAPTHPVPTQPPMSPTTHPSPTASPAPPSSPAPSSPVPSSPVPTPPPSAAPGTLSVFGPGGPYGGTLVAIPGGPGGSIFLRASGGAVNWSVSVANDPGGVISVGPSSSGTLTPASPAVTVTITASQSVRCGPGSHTACPSLSVNPGGTTYVVWTGWVQPPHHRRHDSGSSRPALRAV